MLISGAERMRKHRARKRSGAIVLPPMEIGPITIEVLIDAGFLAEWDAEDPVAIARAVAALLSSLRGVTA